MAGGPAINAEPERQGFLLDLMTGADDDAASLQKLADASARWISTTAGTAIECAAVLHRQRSCPASAGSTPAAASLALDDETGDDPAAIASALLGPAVINPGGARWQAYRRRLTDRGFGAGLAVPLELQPGSAGTLVFLGPTNYVFNGKVVDEAAWFAGVASHSLKLALDVHGVIRAGDNLKQVLESRTSIDVACGVLMAQNRCSYAEAFGKLAGTSRHRNLKVRSVAEGLLRSLPSGAPVTRFEPPAIA